MTTPESRVRLVAGPPCAGKTTWALGEMARGDVIVDLDRFMHALTNGPPHARDGAAFDLAEAARKSCLASLKAHAGKTSVYVTMTLPKAADREAFCRRHGAKSLLLMPSKAECLDRLAADTSRPKALRGQLAAAINRWFADYTPSAADTLLQPSTRMMLMNRETRDLPAGEVRFSAEDTGTFTGYAAVFGEPNSFGEIVKPGAFRKTLAERKRTGGPALLWQHDTSQPIGVWQDLAEDARGLKVTGKLVTETARGAEALALLKAGAVSGLSIGFRARSAERAPNGARVLTDIELVEISLVTLPAASKARVTSVRGAAGPAGAAAFVEAARRAAIAIKRT